MVAIILPILKTRKLRLKDSKSFANNINKGSNYIILTTQMPNSLREKLTSQALND